MRLFFLAFMLSTGLSTSAYANFVSVKVEHIWQETNLCVPTSVAIVLDSFGEKRSPKELKVLSIGKKYNPSNPFTDFTPTWFKDMISGLKTINRHWSSANFTNDDAGFRKGIVSIEKSLKQGNPVIVDTSGIYADGHTLVVSGIDTTKKRVFMVDPYLPPPGRREMSFEEFRTKWNSTAVGWAGRAAIFPVR